MNSFGRLFRFSIFGESHGPGLGVLLDGVPPGISLGAKDFLPDITRRRSGAPGTTPRQEADTPLLESGCHLGRTTGAPLLIRFENKATQSRDYEAFSQQPRPGHADWTARVKYKGCHDPRGGGHFSGRLTLGLVAAGVVAKKVLAGVVIQARLLSVGGRLDQEAAVSEAMGRGDSLGGLVACRVDKLPPGLGEPFCDSLESLLAHLLFAIPGVRGVEFGDGFAAADMSGSAHNDCIVDETGRTATNHCGGVNGGISNGNPLAFQVAFKPTASICAVQDTHHFGHKRVEALRVGGRHDACFALRTPVIVEAAAALVLADLVLLHRGPC
jgi:chorismate synthase